MECLSRPAQHSSQESWTTCAPPSAPDSHQQPLQLLLGRVQPPLPGPSQDVIGPTTHQQPWGLLPTTLLSSRSFGVDVSLLLLSPPSFRRFPRFDPWDVVGAPCMLSNPGQPHLLLRPIQPLLGWGAPCRPPPSARQVPTVRSWGCDPSPRNSRQPLEAPPAAEPQMSSSPVQAATSLLLADPSVITCSTRLDPQPHLLQRPVEPLLGWGAGVGPLGALGENPQDDHMCRGVLVQQEPDHVLDGGVRGGVLAARLTYLACNSG